MLCVNIEYIVWRTRSVMWACLTALAAESRDLRAACDLTMLKRVGPGTLNQVVLP